MEESISRSGTRTDLHRRPRSRPGLLRSPPPHRPRAGPVNPASLADPAPRRDSLSRLACSRRPSAHRGRVPGLLWPSCGRSRSGPARSQEIRCRPSPPNHPRASHSAENRSPAPYDALEGSASLLSHRLLLAGSSAAASPPSAPGAPQACSGLGALDFPFSGVAFPCLCKAAPSRHPGQTSPAQGSAF